MNPAPVGLVRSSSIATADWAESVTGQQTSSLAVAGLRIGAAAAGIRYRNRDDLVLMELAEGSSVVAAFTRNAFRAAPILVAEEHLASASPRALLINAGNANAGTGEAGLEAASHCCQLVANRLGCEVTAVVPFSTGVIGEQLPVERFSDAVASACDNLTTDGWERAARAILTTDTRPKVASRRVALGERRATVTGMAKGAGMICPDMATLLAFVVTDARVQRAALREMLDRSLERSFNRITIDGDTSTNDACVLAATGAVGNASIADCGTEEAAVIAEALAQVCEDLAEAVVRDGEGATKFIRVRVQQGRDVQECRQVAYCIAHSPLVKTACYASDANWGRILAATGRAALPGFDIQRVDILLDDVLVVHHGGRHPDYQEALGAKVMAGPEIAITVVLRRGNAETEIWTCDLSHDYVSINAEYRS